MVSQLYIFFLMLIAARVAYGLSQKKVMWPWIVSYWLMLTCKNFSDLIGAFL